VGRFVRSGVSDPYDVSECQRSLTQVDQKSLTLQHSVPALADVVLKPGVLGDTAKVLRCRYHLIRPDGGRLSAKLVPAADILATTCGAHLITSSAAAGCYLARQMFDMFTSQLEGPNCIYLYWTTFKSSLHWKICGVSVQVYKWKLDT
jgi:hypothetical protein